VADHDPAKFQTESDQPVDCRVRGEQVVSISWLWREEDSWVFESVFSPLFFPKKSPVMLLPSAVCLLRVTSAKSDGVGKTHCDCRLFSVFSKGQEKVLIKEFFILFGK
jgi:hypothetical protein